MSERQRRAVALTDAAYDSSKTAAEQAGLSQAAWVARAIEAQRRREDAAAYAAYIAQPQIATQITAMRAARQPGPAYEPAA